MKTDKIAIIGGGGIMTPSIRDVLERKGIDLNKVAMINSDDVDKNTLEMIESGDIENIDEMIIHERLNEFSSFKEEYLTIRNLPKPEDYDQIMYGHLTKKQREADIVPIRTTPKIARNAQCPCGSGKKYKNCCLK